MRKLIILLCLCVCFVACGQTYNYHYWFDTNEGEQKSGTVTGNSLQLDIPTSGLSDWYHTLHIQVIDGEGNSSPVLSRTFAIVPTNTVDRTPSNYRYWFDSDEANMQTGAMTGNTFTMDVPTEGLTDWFKAQNDSSEGKLRKVVRLSKMFCKSRDSWVNMPSGLLQTVLCDEKLQDYDRTDELFYYTMKGIVDRLELNTSVSAPVDNGRNLTPRQSDIQKMTNWKNRLKSKLEDLDILFNEECSQEDAIQAWYGFFNHDYWRGQVSDLSCYTLSTVQKAHICTFNDNEQFIEDLYPVRIYYNCGISCRVSGNGWREKPISEFLGLLQKFVPHNFRVKCSLSYTTCPKPYQIFWKVKNVGPEAERRNMIRGGIRERGKAIEEPTSFYGNHYIECYIVKDDVCVARNRVEVPIGRR